MNVGKLTKANIDHVFSHLSDESRYEIDFLNKTVEEVYDHFIQLIGVEFTMCLYHKRVPCMLLALEPTGQSWHDRNTWCAQLVVAKDAWRDVGFSITHMLARLSDELLDKADVVIEAYSPYDYGKWFDWLLALGFMYVGKCSNRTSRYVKVRRDV